MSETLRIKTTHIQVPTSFDEKQIVFKTQNISQRELFTATELVNSGGQLAVKLTPERLKNTFHLIVVKRHNDVIGVSSIKAHNKVAEIGYTYVNPSYRRLQIGQQMTEQLIDHAMKNGISMLCGMVSKSNIINQNKLKKLGFFRYSEFLSRTEKTILCWYCHPLLLPTERALSFMNAFLEERQQRKTHT